MLQDFEFKSLVEDYDDFAVDDAAFGQGSLYCRDDFGRVARHRFFVTRPIFTWSPSRKMIERNPSHFGSKLSAPSGICGTALASIGATGGTTDRFKVAMTTIKS